MTAMPERQHRPKKAAQVVRVVRYGDCASYVWDRKPNRHDCNAALLADPPCRPRVGHCWPGFDEQPYDSMPTPTIIPTGEAPNRTRRPAPDLARPTRVAGQDWRVRCSGGA